MRLATRAMLLLAAYCREVGAHAEANYALMRAHFQASRRHLSRMYLGSMQLSTRSRIPRGPYNRRRTCGWFCCWSSLAAFCEGYSLTDALARVRSSISMQEEHLRAAVLKQVG